MNDQIQRHTAEEVTGQLRCHCIAKAVSGSLDSIWLSFHFMDSDFDLKKNDAELITGSLS